MKYQEKEKKVMIEDCSLSCVGSKQLGRCLPAFWRNVMPPTYGHLQSLKLCSSKCCLLSVRLHAVTTQKVES